MEPSTPEAEAMLASRPKLDWLMGRQQTEEYESPLDLLMLNMMPCKTASVSIGCASIRQPEEDKAAMQRQSSIASFHDLSLNDCMSVNESQFSHYIPSINEPFVSEDADPIEKEMHAFLDSCGVFQVNIKQQLEIEKKSTYSASASRRSFFQNRKSPSFFERRQNRIASQKESTAGSSSGPKSQNVSGLRASIQLGAATFGSDIFNTSHKTSSSVPKSVEEEPHSASSPCIQKTSKTESGLPGRNLETLQNEMKHEASNKKATALKIQTKPVSVGYSVLRDDNDHASEQGISLNLLMPQPRDYSAVRHQSLTPPCTNTKLSENMDGAGTSKQSESQAEESHLSQASIREEHSSHSSFQIQLQCSAQQFEQENENSGMELLRKQSDPPMLGSRSRQMGFHSLAIQVPSFSAGNASEEQEPLSAASFAAQGAFCQEENCQANAKDIESPENQTPTLPCRHDSSEDDPTFIDLDKELLSQTPDKQNLSQTPTRNFVYQRDVKADQLETDPRAFMSPEETKVGGMAQLEQLENKQEQQLQQMLEEDLKLRSLETPDTPFFNSHTSTTSDSALLSFPTKYSPQAALAADVSMQMRLGNQ